MTKCKRGHAAIMRLITSLIKPGLELVKFHDKMKMHFIGQ